MSNNKNCAPCAANNNNNNQPTPKTIEPIPKPSLSNANKNVISHLENVAKNASTSNNSFRERMQKAFPTTGQVSKNIKDMTKERFQKSEKQVKNVTEQMAKEVEKIEKQTKTQLQNSIKELEKKELNMKTDNPKQESINMPSAQNTIPSNPFQNLSNHAQSLIPPETSDMIKKLQNLQSQLQGIGQTTQKNIDGKHTSTMNQMNQLGDYNQILQNLQSKLNVVEDIKKIGTDVSNESKQFNVLGDVIKSKIEQIHKTIKVESSMHNPNYNSGAWSWSLNPLVYTWLKSYQCQSNLNDIQGKMLWQGSGYVSTTALSMLELIQVNQHEDGQVYILGKSWNSDTNRYSMYVEKFSLVGNEKLEVDKTFQQNVQTVMSSLTQQASNDTKNDIKSKKYEIIPFKFIFHDEIMFIGGTMIDEDSKHSYPFILTLDKNGNMDEKFNNGKYLRFQDFGTVSTISLSESKKLMVTLSIMNTENVNGAKNIYMSNKIMIIDPIDGKIVNMIILPRQNLLDPINLPKGNDFMIPVEVFDLKSKCLIIGNKIQSDHSNEACVYTYDNDHHSIEKQILSKEKHCMVQDVCLDNNSIYILMNEYDHLHHPTKTTYKIIKYNIENKNIDCLSVGTSNDLVAQKLLIISGQKMIVSGFQFSSLSGNKNASTGFVSVIDKNENKEDIGKDLGSNGKVVAKDDKVGSDGARIYQINLPYQYMEKITSICHLKDDSFIGGGYFQKDESNRSKHSFLFSFKI